MVFWQFVPDDDRANRQDGAVQSLIANAQESAIGRAMGVIDRALVAQAAQLGVRKRGGCTGGTDQDRVRTTAHDLECLAADR
ncbi:hypothetical protein D3C76_1359930 [compost metagenome]